MAKDSLAPELSETAAKQPVAANRLLNHRAPTPQAYASFLVRLWREVESDLRETAAGWQGEVQHIQTSQRQDFSTLDELLSILRQVTDDADAPGRMADK